MSFFGTLKEQWAGLSAISGALVLGVVAPGYIDAEVQRRVETIVLAKTEQLQDAANKAKEAAQEQKQVSEENRKLFEQRTRSIEGKLDRLMLELIRQGREKK